MHVSAVASTRRRVIVRERWHFARRAAFCRLGPSNGRWLITRFVHIQSEREREGRARRPPGTRRPAREREHVSVWRPSKRWLRDVDSGFQPSRTAGCWTRTYIYLRSECTYKRARSAEASYVPRAWKFPARAAQKNDASSYNLSWRIYVPAKSTQCFSL